MHCCCGALPVLLCAPAAAMYPKQAERTRVSMNERPFIPRISATKPLSGTRILSLISLLQIRAVLPASELATAVLASVVQNECVAENASFCKNRRKINALSS
ncbi:hypothetical protein BDN67DRAFT_350419 [Paxillus ammoniavirescens]|nr:hypothetical protein BDN67DRAFT_350419 [Paxillus ammoniavirescens]